MTRSVKLRLVKSTSPDTFGMGGGSAEGHEPAPTSDRQVVGALADDGLVALVLGGDSRAAEVLYRRHATFAFNLAARIAGTTTDVEDVVHDAFIRAFDNLAALRKPSAFKTWLGSIVVHAMRSRLRRARFVRLFGLGQAGDPIDIECLAADDASPQIKAELAQVYALLKTLSADDRIAWTLRHVEGHDLGTAADLAGCSLATIKRRIRRAQKYLEDHYVTTDAAALDEAREPSSASGASDSHPRKKKREEAVS